MILRRTAFLAAAAPLMFPLACALQHDESTSSQASAVAGGFDARDPAFDAVGALVNLGIDGQPRSAFCSASLIGRRTILTAEHCLLSSAGPLSTASDVGFAIGSDSYAPRRVVPIVRWEAVNLPISDLSGLGGDVAIGHLSESVDDIEPLPIGTLDASDVGRKFMAVGYGGQSCALYERPALDAGEPPPPPADAAPSAIPDFGTRRAGSMTLRAVDGKFWPLQYANFDDFVRANAVSDSDPALERDPAYRAAKQKIWDETLVQPGFDAIVGGLFGEASIRGGDSGSPLLRLYQGKMHIFAVLSSKEYLQPPPGGAVDLCVPPAIYAVLGTEARHLIHSASACGGVTQAGECDGDEVVRCSFSREGTPRILRTDCTAIGFKCGRLPNETACLPACESDADCAVRHPEGTCVAGTCKWTRQCKDEETQGACAICCFAAGSAADCESTCSALPAVSIR